MRSFRSKPVGWRNESYRHYLAAKGVRTKSQGYFVKRSSEELPSWDEAQRVADKRAMDEALFREEEKFARGIEETYPSAVTSGAFRSSMFPAKDAALSRIEFGIAEKIRRDIEERDERDEE